MMVTRTCIQLWLLISFLTFCFVTPTNGDFDIFYNESEESSSVEDGLSADLDLFDNSTCPPGQFHGDLGNCEFCLGHFARCEEHGPPCCPRSHCRLDFVDLSETREWRCRCLEDLELNLGVCSPPPLEHVILFAEVAAGVLLAGALLGIALQLHRHCGGTARERPRQASQSSTAGLHGSEDTNVVHVVHHIVPSDHQEPQTTPDHQFSNQEINPASHQFSDVGRNHQFHSSSRSYGSRSSGHQNEGSRRQSLGYHSEDTRRVSVQSSEGSRRSSVYLFDGARRLSGHHFEQARRLSAFYMESERLEELSVHTLPTVIAEDLPPSYEEAIKYQSYAAMILDQSHRSESPKITEVITVVESSSPEDPCSLHFDPA